MILIMRVIIRFMTLQGAESLFFLALPPLLFRIQDEWLNRRAPAQGNDRIQECFQFWAPCSSNR